MRRIILLASLLLGLTAVSPASAKTAQAVCSDLNRPNIDCVCVADRMKMLKGHTSSDLVKNLLSERYAYSVGAKDVSDLERAEKAFNSDQNAMLSTIIAYDEIDGMPQNFQDFEAGCVISNVEGLKFAAPAIDSVAGQYVEARVVSVGEDYRNNSVCMANRMSSYLSDDEFLAFQLSYSYYAKDISQDDNVARARKMGISTSRYKQLSADARKKHDVRSEQDESYCAAMTYAERITPEQNQEALDRQARFAASFAALPSVETALSGGDETKARRIMQAECQANGSSDGYCQCVMADFEKKVVGQSPRPSVTLAWTAMRSGAGMPQEALMKIMTETSREDQEAAGQLFISTLDVGDQCVEAVPETAALKGDPRSRMIEICMADTGDENLCACTTDKMREKLNADNFELIVDIREADFRGASDPLAQVAADRGLSTKEAEEAMAMNQNLMGGMMSMDLMSCMGGMPSMPDFSQIPGMPNIPGQ